MYPNLNAEFARRGLTLQKVAEELGIGISTLSGKIRNGGFTLKEAKQIKKFLNIDMSIEELFEEAE